MPSNDFLVFAGAGGANVVSQSTYASMAALAGGFVTGIAESNQLNKVWRQGSIMAAILGQLSADITGANSVDDGTTTTLLGNLLTSILAAGYGIDTGVANSYTMTLSPVPVTPLFDGAVYSMRPLNTNTGASTLAVNGSPAHAILAQNGAALQGGEIVAGQTVTLIYSSNLSSFIVMLNSGGYQHSATPLAGDSSTKVATTAFVGANGLGAQVIAKVSSAGSILHQNGPNTIAVVHSGTGVYTITFGTALPTANYIALAMTTTGFFTATEDPSGLSASGFILQTFNSAGGTPADAGFNLAVFY